MNSLKIFLFVLIVSLQSFAQVTEEWVSRYNGTGNGSDSAYSLAVDGSGNVYVTGSSSGSGTGTDYTTIKYNSAGVEQWVSIYNGPGNSNDIARSIAVDGSGNVYVTGQSRGSVNWDYATIKYNSSGIEEWVQRYNGPGNAEDFAYSIAVDGSGNASVTGYSWGSTHYDYTTIKYSSSGVEQWVQRYNGTGNNWDWAVAITADVMGNVYVTGRSWGLNTSGIGWDIATIKYNSSGIQQWVQRYDGPGNWYDEGTSIAVDGSGNVYVTGYSSGIGTDRDITTIKYDSFGVEQWVQRYDGPGHVQDFGTSIAVDGLGNVYVTGFGFGSGTNNDYATIKYNSSGIEQWVQRYNAGNGDDRAYSIAVDGSGNAYVTGYSYIGGPGDDYATIKYNSSGVQLWLQRYNGPANSGDQARSIAVDGSGNVYVTGYSFGSGTGRDYATIKYSQTTPLIVNAGADQSIYGGCVIQAATLTASVSGGTEPYNYLWSPGGATTQSITVSPTESTTYTVTVTDAFNQNATDEVAVNVTPASLSVNAGQDAEIFLGYGSQSVQLTANAEGGYEPYSYLWSPGGATTQSITASCTTSTAYIVQVTNSIGCVKTDTVMVYVYDTRCGNNGNKILVCHNGHTICVSINAIPAHLEHGDQLDSCEGGYDYQNAQIPLEYNLHMNYPNPFNPVTTIKYDLPFVSEVQLTVYDLLGQTVAVLVNEIKEPGYYSVNFSGNSLASGIYFYKLTAFSNEKSYVSIKKMVLIK